MNEKPPFTAYDRDILVDKVWECLNRRIQELVTDKTEQYLLDEAVKIRDNLNQLKAPFKELPIPDKQPETPEVMEVYSSIVHGPRIANLFNWLVSTGVIFTYKSQSDLDLDSVIYINGDKYRIYVTNEPKKIKTFIGQMLKVLKTSAKK